PDTRAYCNGVRRALLRPRDRFRGRSHRRCRSAVYRVHHAAAVMGAVVELRDQRDYHLDDDWFACRRCKLSRLRDGLFARAAEPRIRDPRAAALAARTYRYSCGLLLSARR